MYQFRKFASILLICGVMIAGGCSKIPSGSAASEFEPIDKSLNCEEILLECADELHTVMTEYLSYDKSRLVFELGDVYPQQRQAETYKVISNELKSYDDFANIFSGSISRDYLDIICSGTPRLQDIDGALYFTESVGGYLGTLETWYLGCEITDYEIIGHFALLGGVEDEGLSDAEYLNNEENYDFYDIVVRNCNGKYLLTDCRGSDEKRLYYRLHGWCYNLGKADRSLVTNEKVKPKNNGVYYVSIS